MQALKNAIFLNLEDFGGGNLPIGLILLFFFAGLIAATVISQLTNAMLYRAIQALVRHKAIDRESAKTLSALGLSDDRALIRALKSESAMLKRFVAISEQESDAEAESGAEAKKIVSERIFRVSYYLSPAHSDRARQLISESEPTILRAIGYCLLLAALYLLIALLSPVILPLIL